MTAILSAITCLVCLFAPIYAAKKGDDFTAVMTYAVCTIFGVSAFFFLVLELYPI